MTAPMTPEQLDVIRDLSAKGVFVSEIARQLGVTDRAVTRRRARMGLSRPTTRRMDEATRERVLCLRAEGMPGRWIAEDVGFNEDWIYKIAPGSPEDVREWRSAWMKIRKNPTLVALHREFAPS